MEYIKVALFAWCCFAVVGDFEGLASEKPPYIKLKKRHEDEE